MKFLVIFENSKIPEWQDFYLDYFSLKNTLKELKIQFELTKNKYLEEKELCVTKKLSTLSIQDQYEVTPELTTKMYPIATIFKNELILELDKVFSFYVENLIYYRKRVNKFSNQLHYLRHTNELLDKDIHLYLNILEKACKELYKELHLMKDFIEINEKAEEKIIKKFTKYAKSSIDAKSLELLLDEIKLHTLEIIKSNPVLPSVIHKLESVFTKNFFEKYKLEAKKILKDYLIVKPLSTRASFLFGFFFGILAFLLTIIILISIHFHIDMDLDPKFKQTFPMFRGMIIICLYLWLLGLNKYAWSINRINYQIVFQFSNHYSKVVSEFKRVSYFSCATFLMILFYMMIRFNLAPEITVIHFIPYNMTPLICWIVFLGYYLFPAKIFNYLGRLYFFRILWEAISLQKTDFIHTWVMDNFSSLTGVIRDVCFMICFYSNYDTSYSLIDQKCHIPSIWIQLISLIPHFIRLLQCIKISYMTRKYPQMINSCKYSISILTALLSYISRATAIAFFWHLWLTFIFVSAIFGFCWDIKMGWGFLDKSSKNYPLREKLSYNSKAFYYFCIVMNFIFRFFFILSISPDVVYTFIRPEFFLLLIYSAEVFRRSTWNFLRVEHQHIIQCKDFRATMFIECPLRQLPDGEFEVKKISNKNDLEKVNLRLDRIRMKTQTKPVKDNMVFLKRLNRQDDTDYLSD